MTNLLPILADGFAPFVFFGVVALLWVLGALFGKSNKPTPIVPIGRDDELARRHDANVRQRHQASRAGPPPLPAVLQQHQAALDREVRQRQQQLRQQQQQQQPGRRGKKGAKAFPRTAPPQLAATIATIAPPVQSVSRQTQSETARNLRLMLQRGGIREAVLLTEVLGKPKSLRDEI